MAKDRARMVPNSSSPARTSLIGRVLDGRYELEALLGAGGMGAVYRATDRGTQRAVAVKVLHPELGTNPSISKRFERETTSLWRLDHPNCVHVTDSGATGDGITYLVMELLEGEELTARLGPDQLWQPDATCELLAQLLAGLAHAHAHGIVHRDLKPANVFMTSDSSGREVAKIVDFGIAKLLDSDGSTEVVTQVGMVLGTPRYMSPEQAVGGKTDERCDLYAIGILAHELLTGAPPFDADDLGAILRMQIIAPPPPLPDTVPAALAAWVATMLEKSRHERPASASEARARLMEILAGLRERGSAQSPSPTQGSQRPVWPGPERDLAPTSKGVDTTVVDQHGPSRPRPEAMIEDVEDVDDGRARLEARRHGLPGEGIAIPLGPGQDCGRARAPP